MPTPQLLIKRLGVNSKTEEGFLILKLTKFKMRLVKIILLKHSPNFFRHLPLQT
jgi:hypothetical protein